MKEDSKLEMDNYFMIFFLLLFFIITIYGIKFNNYKEEYFLPIENTCIRGVLSIIIIMVHIPVYYQNHIQDMIGSFAYIGVTMFFMFSSYGLMFSIENKKDYLKGFWTNRILKIMIPFVLISIINVLLKLLFLNYISYKDLIVHEWVIVYILLNIIFYLFHFRNKNTDMKANENICKNIIIMIIILSFSMITQFTSVKILLRWPVESLGFIYGIIIYYIINNKKKRKIEKFRVYLLKVLILLLICLIVGGLYCRYKTVVFWGNYFLRVLLSIMLILLLEYTMKKIEFGNRLIKIVGEISYEIYLFQFVIFYNFKEVSFISSSFYTYVYL